MRKIITTIICSCMFLVMSAGKATFHRIWLEHNITQNGQKGLMVHVSMNIFGMPKKNCTAVAYFECPKGTGVKDLNGRYHTTNGMVSASKTMTPYYVDQNYYDFTIFIPYSELHLLPGKRTYYTKVHVFDSNGKSLGCSQYASFEGTGSSSSNQYANKPKRNSNSNSRRNNHSNSKGSVQTWRENLGAGMYAINRGNPKGVHERTIYRTCVSCRGTGNCLACQVYIYRKGECPHCHGCRTIHLSTASMPCWFCNMTGNCSQCNGTGDCLCKKKGHPGYMPSSTLVVDANGNIIHNSHYNGGASSSSSKSSTSRSSGGNCPSCGGRGYEITIHSYAAKSGSGWKQPYHHTGGTKCPYCSVETPHYHYPCSQCRGFGHL